MPFVPDQPETPKSSFVPDTAKEPADLSPSNSNLSDVVKQQMDIKMQAAYTGMLSLGTTLAKALSKTAYSSDHPVDKMFQKVLPTPETIQNYYDKQVQLDQEGRAKELPSPAPLSAEAFNMYGAIAPTALVPLPSGAIAGAEAVSKLPLLSKFPTAAKTLGSVLGGGAEGVAYGAAYTKPGQSPDEVLNKEGALFGGKLGLSLGPLMKYADSMLGRSAEYEQYANAANVTYKGKTTPYRGFSFNRDLSGNYVDDTLGTFRRTMGNGILDSLIGGTGANRIANNGYMKETLEGFINNLSQKTVGQSEQAIKNNIINAKTMADKNEHKAWDYAYKVFDDQGIKVSSLDNYNHYNSQLPNYADGLTSSQLARVTIPNTEDLSFKTIHKLKQDTWNVYSELAKKTSPSTEQVAAADALLSQYHGLNTDIRNSIVATGDTTALKAFESANAYTQGNKFMFDPKKEPELFKAVLDMNEKQVGLQKFMDFATSGKMTTRQAQQVYGLAGNQVNELQNVQLRKLYEGSITNSGNLDIDKWLTGVKNMEANPGQQIIMGEPLEAIKGLNLHMKNQVRALEEAKAGSAMTSMVTTATSGGLMGGAYLGLSGQPVEGAALVAATLLTPAALGFISANSPIKRMSMFLNRNVEGGSNPGLTQYITNELNKQMIKAGLVMEINDEGQAILDKKKDAINKR